MTDRMKWLLIGLVLAGCARDYVIEPSPAATPAMPLADARKVVRQAFYTWAPYGYSTVVSDVRVDAAGVVAIVAPGWSDGWRDGSKVPRELSASFAAPLGRYKCQDGSCFVEMPPQPAHGAYWVLKAPSPAEAQRLVQAYDSLVARNLGAAQGQAEFAEAAARWKAMKPRPRLSEQAERHRVLAEAAFRDKDLDTALEHYEAALETDPTWPNGNFNLALLLGEAGYYANAKQYMERYLLLVPDARDAKAAREKIMVWEDKLARRGRGS